jgi:AcrR family transcriptional regulator
MVNKTTGRPSRKLDLFIAATRLVGREGIEALTIDGLAKAAGVTKGGIQYHFQSKDQLITELLEFLLGSFDEELEGKEGVAWLEAFVDLTLSPETEGDAAAAAILAALPPGDPRAAPYEFYATKWRKKADALPDPALAQIVRLAADGLWLERAYGRISTGETRAIVRKLKALIQQNKP